MSVYLNGSNTQNIVTGAGLSSTGHDDFGNSVLSLTGLPAAQTSAQFLASVTNPTGTGLLVFGTSPTLITPIITVPVSGLANRGYNGFSATPQSPVAATRTYIAGAAIGPFAAGTIQVGTTLTFTFDLVKTAAGIASSTIDVAFGTAGTTADTAQLSFTKPAGVAAIDEGFCEITVVFRSVGAAAVAVGELVFFANNTGGSGGHLASGKYVYAQNVVSGSFSTLTPTFAGVCITSGAADAVTVNVATAQAINL